MFRTDTLPDFIFVGDDGCDTAVDMRATTPRIRAVADYIAARVKRGSCVGLLFTSEPNLMVNWLACLAAGMRPLVMQYPTRKQSRDYWMELVRNTIGVAEVAAIVADDYCAGHGLSEVAATITQRDLDALKDGSGEPIAFDDFTIVQLSSGTTGFRKAMEFTSAHLRRHVDDYNATLKLTKADTIVSWLPLYHDMGYIACFVMPMALGMRIVMMDPMTWVRRPELLYDAIERHKGAICFMPNFGYEVMSRVPARDLSSVRWWIATAETVSPDTVRKFVAAAGIEPDTFAPSYGAAENIFAITLRRGLSTQRIEEVDVTSCGRPIRGVDIKIVDGEIRVRSPASIATYLGGGDTRDAEGYYASGDLGQVIDGELYVLGRKQDLLVQAGRKYMLSDIDLVINRLYPDIRGRAVAVQVYDERLGTQKPVILIESQEFFTRTDRAEIADAIKVAIGLDQVEVDFVPPRFLTKTSSGKLNRKKSAEDWLLLKKAVKPDARDPVAEMRTAFPNVAWDRPVGDVLDSLSLTVLRIILSDTRIVHDPKLTLDEIAARIQSGPRKRKRRVKETIRIASLADGRTTHAITEEHLDQLEVALGAPVTFEHVCLPPSPVILSDLIFADYFRPRIDQGQFAAINAAFDKLRDASLILTDDVVELMLLSGQVYGTLSHAMERDPRADLISLRWQRYVQFHHLLPLTVVAGADLALADRSRTQAQLAAYLKKPIFRVAMIEEFAPFTKDWEYRVLHAGGSAVKNAIDPSALITALAEWALARGEPLHRSRQPAATRLDRSDLRHFCSTFTHRAAIDNVLAAFDSFCVVGQDASVPYVRKALDRLGKRYVTARSYAPEILKTVPDEFECLLICGAMGDYPIDKPAVAIMPAVPAWRTLNIDDPDVQALVFHDAAPESGGTDWFYPFALDRHIDRAAVKKAQQAAHAEADRFGAERAERRQALQERRKAREGRLKRRAEWQARRAQRRQAGPGE